MAKRRNWIRDIVVVSVKMILLLFIYGAVLHVALKSVFKYLELRQLSRELAIEKTDYERLLKEYSEALLVSSKLKGDAEFQRSILKESGYYFELNEEPLVIIEE